MQHLKDGLHGSMLWSQFSAIFADFRFFPLTNAMIKFLQKLAAVWATNANIFDNFFGENILKNHNIGPRFDA
jgi:hypothetical protein